MIGEAPIPLRFGEDERFWHLIRVELDRMNVFMVFILNILVSIISSYLSHSILLGVALFAVIIFSSFVWAIYRTADDLYYENLSLKKAQNHLPSVIR